MPASQDVTVRIYGQEYTLRSDADPEALQSLAAQVDERMREAAAGTGPISAERLAVLVALNLADDLAQQRLAGEVSLSAAAVLPGARERLERLITSLADEVGNEGADAV
jgi:cell division protein ZapA